MSALIPEAPLARELVAEVGVEHQHVRLVDVVMKYFSGAMPVLPREFFYFTCVTAYFTYVSKSAGVSAFIHGSRPATRDARSGGA